MYVILFIPLKKLHHSHQFAVIFERKQTALRSSNCPDFFNVYGHISQPYRLGIWSRFTFEIHPIVASSEVKPYIWQDVSTSRKQSTIELWRAPTKFIC